MWGLYILFIAFVFLWKSGDRISLPIYLRTHGFVPSIIGDPDSNTLLSFEILSLFFWLMASCRVASRSLEPFLKDKYPEVLQEHFENGAGGLPEPQACKSLGILIPTAAFSMPTFLHNFMRSTSNKAHKAWINPKEKASYLPPQLKSLF